LDHGGSHIVGTSQPYYPLLITFGNLKHWWI